MPSTPAAAIAELLPFVDLVLVMDGQSGLRGPEAPSVLPGQGPGAPFVEGGPSSSISRSWWTAA